MTKKKDFYGNGQGDRLIDPLFYPKGINLFLEDEEKLLKLLLYFKQRKLLIRGRLQTFKNLPRLI